MHPALLGAIGVAGGALIALDRIANRVVKPIPREPDVGVPELGLDHEDLVIPAGGHTLRGWLLRSAQRRGPEEAGGGDPLVLMTHGWGANYGTLLKLAVPLVRAGYDVLLFDIRGHGRNEEVPYATVRHFRDDVMSAARYAEGRFPGRPLVLLGHSLGGAAGVLAAAEGAPLAGVGTLASPADVLSVTAAYLSDKGLPGAPLVWLLRPFWWLRVGGSFRPLTPGRRVRELKIPVLVVQPEFDARVPMEHAVRLAEGAGTEVRIVPGAGHTDMLGCEETLRFVLGFLKEVPADL